MACVTEIKAMVEAKYSHLPSGSRDGVAVVCNVVFTLGAAAGGWLFRRRPVRKQVADEYFDEIRTAWERSVNLGIA